MADEPTLQPSVQNREPSPAPGAAPVLSAEEKAELEELRRYRSEVEPFIGSIAPVWDEYVKPIISDEKEREFYKQAREARQRVEDSQKPTLSPELQALRDELRNEFGPFLEDWKSNKAQREQAQQQSLATAQQTNLAFANRLLAERPELGTNNNAGIYMLASAAARDGLSLEDAWKTYGAGFVAPAKKESPPRSLRSGAAEPGVPGESTQPKTGTSRAEIVKRLEANIRAAKGA